MKVLGIGTYLPRSPRRITVHYISSVKVKGETTSVPKIPIPKRTFSNCNNSTFQYKEIRDGRKRAGKPLVEFLGLPL